jgi:Cu+-exporting ATPase
MTVNPARSAGRHEYAGTTYYFCCEGCRAKFAADPAKYLAAGAKHEGHGGDVASGASLLSIGGTIGGTGGGAIGGTAGGGGGSLLSIGSGPSRAAAFSMPDVAAGAHADAAETHAARETGRASEHSTGSRAIHVCPMCPEVRQEGPGPCPTCGMALEAETIAPPRTVTRYVCPMHPQIVRDEPGTCPICGMALEPQTVTLDEPLDPELASMTRRFWIGLALTLPLVVLSMLEMIPHSPLALAAHGPQWMPWVQLALATPVVLWCGLPFFQRGWVSIRNLSPNMFTLIALGTGAAYAHSVAATLAPSLFPASLRGHDGSVPVYYESAAVITVLVLLGQVLELRARGRTRAAVRALLALAPRTARRVTSDGTDEDVPIEHVRPGDRLRVRPGEKVPVDGVVLEGTSWVDESLLTGEPIPAAKKPGEALTGGTINGTGALLMRAERTGDDTILARIVRMVSDAQRTRAPIQRIADAVASWFVPAVVAVAGVTFAAWALAGPEPRLAYALVSAVSVLIIACPCALGLATPMSIMVGTGRGALAGVLFRSAEALERLGKIDTLVVDKTGTLTEGRPALEGVVTAAGVDEKELLRLAGALERASEHPLARAIARAAGERGAVGPQPADVQSAPGEGIFGTVEGRAVAVGTKSYLERLGVPGGTMVPLAARAESERTAGRTAVFAAIDGRAAGLFLVGDPVKAGAADAIRALHARGIKIVMLTGDARATAEAVARTLGIDTVEAEVLPARKAEVVTRLRAEGRIVAMAGDGVNDAPALASADVGIAMGTGADVAIESAGVTLVKGDLHGIDRALGLSRATMRNIRQNLFFAFVYNLLGVPIAAGVLYPVLGIVLSPMIASAAMSASSVSVIGNALRLRRAPL